MSLAPSPAAAPARPRLSAAIVAAIGLGAFAVAACLSPYDTDGHPRTSGTHRQLGLPECHFRALFGLPCPSCGMTTSVALVMHGDPAAAWHANWAGVVLSVMAAAAVARLLAIALFGVDAGPWSTERTVGWLATGGATVALARWIGLGVWWVCGRPG